MAGGTWDKESLPIRPGLYINFIEQAQKQLTGGVRGIVALPLKEYDTVNGNAVDGKVYEIGTLEEATTLFGVDYTKSIEFALQGGAKKVIAYTLPFIDGTTVTEASAYEEARNVLEAYPFNVFVLDGYVSEQEQVNTVTWVQHMRSEGKHVFFVTGGTDLDDQDHVIGNTRTTTLLDDYVVNLINGVTIEGMDFASSDFAPFVAGIIVGKPLTDTLTYDVLPVQDVTTRLKNSDIKESLNAGSLIFFHDGEKVKIEKGITASGKKVKSIKTRHAIATDLRKLAEDTFIGKIDNNEDGQKSLISANKAYLERLESDKVLTNIEVILDPNIESTGDAVFLQVAYDDIESVERVFLSINL